MKGHLLLGLALLTIMVSAILALNAKSVASSGQSPKAKYTELLNANTGTPVSVTAAVLPETTTSQEQEDAASVALPTSSPTQAIQRLTPPPGNIPYMNENGYRWYEYDPDNPTIWIQNRHDPLGIDLYPLKYLKGTSQGHRISSFQEVAKGTHFYQGDTLLAYSYHTVMNPIIHRPVLMAFEEGYVGNDHFIMISSANQNPQTYPHAMVCDDNGIYYSCIQNLSSPDKIYLAKSKDPSGPYEIKHELSDLLAALFMDHKNNLYAFDYSGIISQINKETGDTILSISTNIESNKKSNISAVFDQNREILYVYCKHKDETSMTLFEVPLATMIAKRIDFIDDYWLTLSRIPYEAWIGAPGRPERLEVKRNEGNFATISFTAPTKTFGGTPLSGNDLGYEILADNKVLYTGNTTVGASVKQKIQFPHSGRFEVSVRLNSTEGKGAQRKIDTFVGHIELPAFLPIYGRSGTPRITKHYDVNNDGGWCYLNGKSAENFTARVENYHNGVHADDWLFLPTLDLEKDKVYRIQYSWQSLPNKPFRHELKLGVAPEVESMGTTIIPECEIFNEDKVNIVTGYMHITETNAYNLGLHDLSDALNNRIILKSFNISDGRDQNVPALASDMKIIPSPKGLLEAVIEIPALDKNLGGKLNKEATTFEVYRDSVLIKKIPNVLPGASTTFTDKVDSAGIYHYTVVPSNCFGKSFETEKNAFIGVNIPASPQNLVMRQSVDGYTLELSWDPVTRTVDGDSISPELVHYKILDRMDTSLPVVVDNLKETSYTCHVLMNQVQQKFASYSVYAVTAKGASIQSNTEAIPVGQKDNAPYKESFSNASLSHLMGISQWEGDGIWTLCHDSTTKNFKSMDDDNGYTNILNTSKQSKADMFTGCVSLAGTEKPELTFGMFLIAAANNPGSMTVEVRDLRADVPQYVTVLQIDTLETYREQEGEYHWVTFKASLGQFKGKDIQVKFTGDTGNRRFLPLDNIQIAGRGFVPGHAADDVTVTGEQGYIYISGAENRQVEVYGIDGRCLYSGTPQCELNLLANAGIYVVKVGEASFKVIVK